MKVAVSGAAGFIGRHVLSELSRHDVDVVAITRGAAFPLLAADRVEVVQMDISAPAEEAYDRLGRPDVLLHLAWGGLPNYRSLHHFEIELPNQYRFLSELVRSGLSSLVVAGTCFEYGMQSGALDESMNPQPDNPYGFAKDVLRRELQYLRDRHPFSFSWGRLFYLYGEGQAASSLLPQLTQAVERGERTFNMSGGEQLRDYLPVSEVARNLVMLALNRLDAGIVNVSAGTPISVRRFVERMMTERGWKIELNLGHYPYPDYEPFAFWGANEKLARLKESALASMGSV